MSGGTVGTLSATAQRKSLGEAKKKGWKGKMGAKRTTTRTTVLNPNHVEWPDVGEEASQQLLAKVERYMALLKLPNRKVPLKEIRGVPEAERSEFRKRWILEQNIKAGLDVNHYTLVRSSVSIGVNCVSKSLELDELAAVIIERNVDPEILTKILVPIANSKSVPVISVPGLNSTFERTTGLRCIALGFKQICRQHVTHEFYSLVEDVEKLYSKIRRAEEKDEVQATTVPDNQPSPISDSLLSSSQEGVTRPTFEEKLETLVNTVRTSQKNLMEAAESGYKPPKIRKVTSNPQPKK